MHQGAGTFAESVWLDVMGLPAGEYSPMWRFAGIICPLNRQNKLARKKDVYFQNVRILNDKARIIKQNISANQNRVMRCSD